MATEKLKPLYGYRRGRSCAAGDCAELLGWAVFERGEWIRTELKLW